MTPRSPSSPASDPDTSAPSWKRLFAPGSFVWSFRMRRGDAERFFAPQDPSGDLLAARNRQLDTHPERYLASTAEGAPLIEDTWQLALGWGQVPDSPPGRRDLASLSRQWEADLLLLDPSTMQVAAAAVCFPSSWDPAHAVGQSLHDVHGVVPRLNPQIGEMITRFLESLAPGKAFRRENWSLTRSADPDYHPALQRARLDDSLTLEEVFLRIEHQVFTGIPSGVLMGLRIETCPLRDLAGDPATWSCLAEKLRTMPEDVARYKAMHSAIPRLLREMEAFQPLAQELSD